jgi:uncharacterized protein YciI
MSLFIVSREAGPAWNDGGIFDQPGAAEHAAFMNGLADEGFVRLGGPLAGSEQGRVRVLLIVDGESEAEIHRRLADDPWAATEQLVVTRVEPWLVLVGEQPEAAR